MELELGAWLDCCGLGGARRAVGLLCRVSHEVLVGSKMWRCSRRKQFGFSRAQTRSTRGKAVEAKIAMALGRRSQSKHGDNLLGRVLFWRARAELGPDVGRLGCIECSSQRRTPGDRSLDCR